MIRLKTLAYCLWSKVLNCLSPDHCLPRFMRSLWFFPMKLTDFFLFLLSLKR